MGQYHKVYNIDKKQFIHPHKIDNGLKLVEQIGHLRSTSTALFLLLSNSNGRGGGDVLKHDFIGKWAGDRVVIQGDYAEDCDNGFINNDDIESYSDISDMVNQMLDVALQDL